ncbi:hypothetical protein TPA0910_51860 [Streptomyces hygroscopicus subsp. sporocinereus]|uniref:Uncharacterized protein n=1 Tax=Streptomyces hygroscopicus TaxID=1912 RepID=A0ABQ3U567_STRHY|nr:hypothetical protein TPA0910_51860 [Streptomyces hygroscopicus]
MRRYRCAVARGARVPAARCIPSPAVCGPVIQGGFRSTGTDEVAMLTVHEHALAEAALIDEAIADVPPREPP